MKKILLCILCTFLLLPVLSVHTSAVSYPDDAVYKTYIYNNRTEPVVIPSAFEVERVIFGSEVAGVDFNELYDIFYDGADRIYLCDCNNDRIVVTDKEFRFVYEVRNFEWDGKSDALSNPQGVYSDGKILYVSDTGNHRIVMFDIAQSFRAERMIKDPEIPALDSEVSFEPLRLTIDNSGGIYVIAKGINQGIVWLDGDGKFIGFVGAPRVEFSLTELFWRNFATKAQKERMESFVPTEYDSVVRDSNGFLYVTSQTSSAVPVGKLNSNGENILKNKGGFADEKHRTDKVYSPYFSDIALGDPESGLYYTIDSKQGRIYCYSREGELMYAFGRNGTQKGTFNNVSSIEFMKDSENNRNRLLVADRSRGTVTVFRETDFGAQIREAVTAYDGGRYEDSAEIWGAVYKEASGYVPAVTGLARIDIQNGDYSKAMKRLLDVRDYSLYADAFGKWRSDFVRDHFPMVMLAILAIAAVCIILYKYARRVPFVKKFANTETGKGYQYGSYVMLHPFDGFWDLKREKRGNMKSALLIAGLFFVLYAVRLQFGGYITTGTTPSEVNVLYNVALIFLPLCFWVIANWCITTLMDGKGTFKDIVIATCYALKPYVLLSIPMLLVSRIIGEDELVFYNFANAVIIIWVFVLLFVGLMITHDYSLSKAVLSVVLILVGICLIIFIMLLFIHIIQEVYLFVYNSYSEVAFRSYSKV